jgi:hypothetical protein
LTRCWAEFMVDEKFIVDGSWFIAEISSSGSVK